MSYRTKVKSDTTGTLVDLPLDAETVKGVDVVNTKENVANKVTSISSSSTDTQYPSAKAVYNAIPTVNNASHIIQLNGNTIGTNFTANASSDITTNIQALPNYSLNISTSAGNPREVKFVRVNYTNFNSNYAAYFKIGAMCSHGNGSSYTFLEDIIIGVTSSGSATCTVYKQVQNASTYTVDNHTVHFGDVYWVVDTTNKYVDFFIICGQYATINFTPFTAIGSTSKSTSEIVQQTDSATLYSSGTRVWDTLGNGSLYAKTSDIPTSIDGLSGGSLTSPLVIYGGDAATASKISLDASRSGQVTDQNTSTLFGFLSNNTTTFTLGGNSYALNLRGSGTRPTYKGNNLALSSDIPDGIVYTTTAPTSANTNGNLKVVVLSSEPATRYSGYLYIVTGN